MTTVAIPEGSPLAETAPKPQKLVKTEANKKSSKPKAKVVKAKTKKSRPKKAPKAPKAKKASTGKRSPKKPSKATKKSTGGKPRGSGIRKDGKPRRSPGTNPASSPENERYGKKVASARKKKDLTQKQLADKMGVSQPGLANIERGVVGASEVMKGKIKKALGLAA